MNFALLWKMLPWWRMPLQSIPEGAKGELKELSSQGLITSDIIKNALFMAADDINDKFGSMPMTFADVWDRIRKMPEWRPLETSSTG